jgi:predicted amidohydrolase YtcJ
MSRLEALRSQTMAPAYAAFEEKTKGSLTVGKLADVTVLTRNLLMVPDEDLRGAAIALTIVGGKVMYRAPGRSAGEGLPR